MNKSFPPLSILVVEDEETTGAMAELLASTAMTPESLAAVMALPAAAAVPRDVIVSISG